MDYDMKELTEIAEARGRRIEELEAELRESCLSELAALGQAEEAYEKQKELEAENARLREDCAEISMRVENCNFDLRGAGYLCCFKGGFEMLGVYNEGDKILAEGNYCHLSNLHILGPVALKERDEKVKVEALREAAGVSDGHDDLDFSEGSLTARCITKTILALIPDEHK